MNYNNDRYVNRYFQNTELEYGIEIYMFTLLIQTMYKSINLSIRISKSNRIWKNIFIQISENDFRNYLEQLAVEFWVQLFSMFFDPVSTQFWASWENYYEKTSLLTKILGPKIIREQRFIDKERIWRSERPWPYSWTRT